MLKQNMSLMFQNKILCQTLLEILSAILKWKRHLNEIQMAFIGFARQFDTKLKNQIQ